MKTQFDELTQNEVEQMLAKLHHVFEKLWEENASIKKENEDLKKITDRLNKTPEKVKKENIKPNISESLIKKEIEVIKEKSDADITSDADPIDSTLDDSHIPEVMSLEFNSDSEPTPSKKADKPKNKLGESETDILVNNEDCFDALFDDMFEVSAKALSGMKIASPVITKSRRRRKKLFSDNKSSIDSDSELSHNNMEIPDDDFEDAMCKVTANLESSQKLTKPLMEPNESMCEDIFATTDDEVQVISKPKICKKLSLNKSLVGIVEISQGRKLVQSKLVLQNVKQKPESLFTLDDEDFSTNWDQQKSQAKVSTQSENPTETEAIIGTPMRSAKPKCSLSLKKSRRNLFEDNDEEQKESKVPNNEAMTKTDASMKDNYFVVPNPLPGPSSAKRKLSEKNVHEESSLLNDETFFSPGEQNRLKQSKLENDSCNNEEFFTSPECPPLLEKENSVTVVKELPYVEKAVRGKEARAKLEGWDCWECEKFYKGMGYSKEETKNFKKMCSRHRSKFNQRVYTPEGFWDPVFQNNYTQSGG